MINKKTKIIFWAAGVIIVIGGIAGGVFYYSTPGQYDEFVRCLKEKKAIFYGAFWCHHCQNQKEMFGRSARLLPYVECSTPDGRGQKETCQKAEITSYPTWEFSDGSRLTGSLSLQQLSDKTTCAVSSS